jgi:hypothetical protein
MTNNPKAEIGQDFMQMLQDAGALPYAEALTALVGMSDYDVAPDIGAEAIRLAASRDRLSSFQPPLREEVSAALQLADAQLDSGALRLRTFVAAKRVNDADEMRTNHDAVDNVKLLMAAVVLGASTAFDEERHDKLYSEAR